VPGNLIISQNQLEFHAIEARVKHADFVGISSATKPVPSDSVPPPLEVTARTCPLLAPRARVR
jgi:hypothetical protein